MTHQPFIRQFPDMLGTFTGCVHWIAFAPLAAWYSPVGGGGGRSQRMCTIATVWTVESSYYWEDLTICVHQSSLSESVIHCGHLGIMTGWRPNTKLHLMCLLFCLVCCQAFVMFCRVAWHQQLVTKAACVRLYDQMDQLACFPKNRLTSKADSFNLVAPGEDGSTKSGVGRVLALILGSRYASSS